MNTFCPKCFESHEIKDFIKLNAEKQIPKIICCNCNKKSKYHIEDSQLFEYFESEIKSLYEYREDMFYSNQKNDMNTTLMCTLEYIVSDIFGHDTDLILKILKENDTLVEFEISDNATWKCLPCWDEPYKNESIDYWKDFCQTAKHENRFSPILFEKLDKIFEHKLKNFELEIDTNTSLYRSRIFDKSSVRTIEEIEKDPDSQMGFSPVHLVKSSGRFNPVGISYGYFSLEEQTTCAEVRANLTDMISIGEFKNYKTLNLLDFRMSEFESIKTKFKYGHCNLCIIYDFLNHFTGEISKPISNDSKEIEYIPTQIIMGYLKNLNDTLNDTLNIDGIIFESSLIKNGNNIVLFNDNKIALFKTKIYEIETIDIKYNLKYINKEFEGQKRKEWIEMGFIDN
ncbi:MAG: RES domain-containing protein [Arcobacteraceae bacterium]